MDWILYSLLGGLVALLLYAVSLLSDCRDYLRNIDVSFHRWERDRET